MRLGDCFDVNRPPRNKCGGHFTHTWYSLSNYKLTQVYSIRLIPTYIAQSYLSCPSTLAVFGKCPVLQVLHSPAHRCARTQLPVSAHPGTSSLISLSLPVILHFSLSLHLSVCPI
jgi:hypothetical protein